MSTKISKKYFQKNNSKKKWDPLLDALIPELFEFPLSDQ
jgi:hypothetical protein